MFKPHGGMHAMLEIWSRADMELFVIGLNHRTAPLEIREKFSVAQDCVPTAIERLLASGQLTEAVVLSTCNRLEIYAVANTPVAYPPGLIQSISDLTALGNHNLRWNSIESALYYHQGDACVRHLFRVASSLDSLVVGETEIVGQIKKAYLTAQSCHGAGKILHRLFQKAFSVSKEVRTRSGIGRCSTSVGAVSVDLAEHIFGEDLHRRSILIIGAGQISETTLKHLAKRGPEKVLVCNRSFEKAAELAKEFNGAAAPWSELPSALEQADIVISSTSAPHFILGQTELSAAMKKRPNRPLFLIDLAVPRDIDPLVLQLNGVYLYNIDQLSEIAHLNMVKRQSEAAACEKLVAEAALDAAQRFLNHSPRPRKIVPAWLCLSCITRIMRLEQEEQHSPLSLTA